MLSDLQELLERSIFHSIRELTVAEGYLPDINNYDIENSNITIAKAAKSDYEASKVNIFNDKGFVIDIFGASNNQSKGYKQIPRIVIDTSSFQPGSLGGDTTPLYRKEDGIFVKTSNPSLSSDFYTNIYAVSNTIEQQRILTSIIATALPRRGYIKTYVNSVLQHNGNIFVQFLNCSDSADLKEGVMEKIFSYQSIDIFESLPRTIPTYVNGVEVNIVPINNIDLTTSFIN